MSEKTKGIPKKAARKRAKYGLYRSRVGKPTRDGRREHHKRAKPCGVMVRYGGGPSITGDSLACIHAAKKSL